MVSCTKVMMTLLFLVASFHCAADGVSEKNLLLDAISNRDHQTLDSLLAEGVDTNSQDKNGFSLLAIAVFAGDLLAVKKLVEAGADINFVNERGIGPLGVAIDRDFLDIAFYLLQQGTNAKTSVIPSRTHPVISVMASYNDNQDKRYIEIAELLLSNGVDPNESMLGNIAALEYALRHKLTPFSKILVCNGARGGATRLGGNVYSETRVDPVGEREFVVVYNVEGLPSYRVDVLCAQ